MVRGGARAGQRRRLAATAYRTPRSGDTGVARGAARAGRLRLRPGDVRAVLLGPHRADRRPRRHSLGLHADGPRGGPCDAPHHAGVRRHGRPRGVQVRRAGDRPATAADAAGSVRRVHRRPFVAPLGARVPPDRRLLLPERCGPQALRARAVGPRRTASDEAGGRLRRGDRRADRPGPRRRHGAARSGLGVPDGGPGGEDRSGGSAGRAQPALSRTVPVRRPPRPHGRLRRRADAVRAQRRHAFHQSDEDARVPRRRPARGEHTRARRRARLRRHRRAARRRPWLRGGVSRPARGCRSGGRRARRSGRAGAGRGHDRGGDGEPAPAGGRERGGRGDGMPIDQPRIVIIGAGPTGLGAGYRLQELGYDDWVILEANDYVGGLATSFTDAAGVTYDIGGHVMFSHYEYYDELVDKLMGGDFTELEREAWVWMEDRFIPYPFQNNIRDLEPQTVFECVNGLISAQRQDHQPTNFREWVDAVMGSGIAKHFMIPYNFKVWATPAELMNFVWIGERVSVVDADSILRNVLLREDNVSWGPNNTFKYPLRGGTGFLYDSLRVFVEDHLELETPVRSVDPVAKEVRTADGRVWPYDVLLNTMPLNRLVGSMESVPDAVSRAVDGLHWSGSHIVGVGIDRAAESTKNWI